MAPARGGRPQCPDSHTQCPCQTHPPDAHTYCGPGDGGIASTGTGGGGCDTNHLRTHDDWRGHCHRFPHHNRAVGMAFFDDTACQCQRAKRGQTENFQILIQHPTGRMLARTELLRHKDSRSAKTQRPHSCRTGAAVATAANEPSSRRTALPRHRLMASRGGRARNWPRRRRRPGRRPGRASCASPAICRQRLSRPRPGRNRTRRLSRSRARPGVRR